MMDCQSKETDRVSELPLFLLHRILSCLPRKDAATTSALSKRWNSVWHSFPIFKFEQDNYIKQRQGTPGFAEKFGKFLSFVDESLQKFTQNKLRMEVLHLKMHLIDNSSIPMVDTWIPLALSNGVSHIYFSVRTNARGLYANHYPLPETTFAFKSNPGSSPFYQLQKLHLTMVYLNENMVRDIIRNCPNISDLCLWFFRGLKTLELSKLKKLKKLIIGVSHKVLEIESVLVDAPHLEDFTFISYERKLPCVIQLNSCRALKRLQLCKCAITDDLFNSYLSRSPLLEYLHISECNMLRRIRISAQKLKCLELYKCEELEVVQIHAPNLSKFTCNTRKNLPVLLSEDVIPCPIEINHFLCDRYGPIDSFWFLKLREFLGVSAQGVHFSLYVDENEVSFDSEALRDIAIPPLVNVDLLELKSKEILAQFDYATLIDGLLWSCHPKAISFGDPLCLSNCIKVLCEKVLGREQPLCCKSSHLKCWRHRLKSAKIENFGGIEDDRSFHVNHLLDSLSSLAEGQEVRFRLDWDLEDI